MVRLKVTKNKAAQTLDFIFQFQYGSIKSFLWGFFGCTFPDFNSNMVRLKVTNGLQKTDLIVIFQFQYGSIKRVKEILIQM